MDYVNEEYLIPDVTSAVVIERIRVLFKDENITRPHFEAMLYVSLQEFFGFSYVHSHNSIDGQKLNDDIKSNKSNVFGLNSLSVDAKLYYSEYSLKLICNGDTIFDIELND